MFSMRSPGSKQAPFVNDKYLLYNTGGYQSLGHTESSLKGNSADIEWSDQDKKDEQDNLERGVHKVIMGDDLGCSQFAYFGTRLDFLNVPYLMDIRGKFFSQAELIYYPSDGKSDILSNLRGSLGFGLSWQLNEMVNFALYYNAVNFNSKVGDIERSNVINFTFNFF